MRDGSEVFKQLRMLIEALKAGNYNAPPMPLQQGSEWFVSCQHEEGVTGSRICRHCGAHLK